MRVKGIACDLDGTLINLEKKHFDAHILAAAKHGITLTFEELLEAIPHAIGGGDRLIVEGLSRVSGGRVSPEILLSLQTRIYEEMIAFDDIVLRPGVFETLCFIQKRDIPLSIGTLTSPAHTDILIRRTGLYAFFPPERIVYTGNGRRPKPAPDIYRETARRMGIDPTEQLVCEDSVPGIIAARSALSYAIAFPIYKDQKNLEHLIDAEAHRIFWDWNEMNIEWILKNIVI